MGKHKGGGTARHSISFCQKCSGELLRALVEDTIRQRLSQEHPGKGLRHWSNADSTMDWILRESTISRKRNLKAQFGKASKDKLSTISYVSLLASFPLSFSPLVTLASFSSLALSYTNVLYTFSLILLQKQSIGLMLFSSLHLALVAISDTLGNKAGNNCSRRGQNRQSFAENGSRMPDSIPALTCSTTSLLTSIISKSRKQIIRFLLFYYIHLSFTFGCPLTLLMDICMYLYIRISFQLS